MDKNENTEIDTAAAATATDAAVVDAPVEVKVTDDEAIIAAIRGEEPATEEAGDVAKPEGEKSQPVEGEAEKKPEEEAKSVLDTETSDDMKGRTKARFDAVLEEGRRQRDENAQLHAQIEESRPKAEWGGQVIQMLGESGGTAEDLAAGIGIIHAVVRGTTENKIRALEEIEKIRVTLSTQLGRPISGVSHLSEFDDLRKMVDEGEIDPAVAEELAATRKANKLRAERETQDEQSRRERLANDTSADQHHQALQQATQTIDGLVNQYLKADGEAEFNIRAQYAKNQSLILRNLGTSVEPSKLPDLFTQFYKSPEADALVQAKMVASARVTTGARPVMGSRMGGNGGASREPGSVEEAILAGLRGDVS